MRGSGTGTAHSRIVDGHCSIYLSHTRALNAVRKKRSRPDAMYRLRLSTTFVICTLRDTCSAHQLRTNAAVWLVAKVVPETTPIAVFAVQKCSLEILQSQLKLLARLQVGLGKA